MPRVLDSHSHALTIQRIYRGYRIRHLLWLSIREIEDFSAEIVSFIAKISPEFETILIKDRFYPSINFRWDTSLYFNSLFFTQLSRDEFDGIDFLRPIDSLYNYQESISPESIELAETHQEQILNQPSNNLSPVQTNIWSSFTDDALIEEAQRIESAIRSRIKVCFKIFMLARFHLSILCY